jgi:glucose-6-phosphate 1-dehydrogenase
MSHASPSSFDLIVFGGTGDLAWRKIIPALFQAHRHGSLGPCRILGVARDQMSDEAYRSLMGDRLAQVEGDKRPTTEEYAGFAQRLHYLRMDLSQPESYGALGAWLGTGSADVVVMYLATAPTLFGKVADQLKAAGLNTPRTRIVLEKPLGHDLASNRAINAAVREAFAESQIFRIDHYLGKPSVQNLLALRFGNTLFEPLWRREWIANIQITISEQLGVESRGAFYEGTGALRDMIQNHALQLLCAVAMEPPISAHADAVRDEKLKVLRSLKPWNEARLAQHVVRGQYSGHSASGALAYRDESGVKPESSTETYVAIRGEIANWRWAGVPFYLRTGKRMAERDARIVVNFRQTPHPIFNTPAGSSNQLVIHLQPKDGIELHLWAQSADSSHSSLAPVQLDLDFDRRFGSKRVGAYERLLMDAIAGRLNLFVRSDEQEAAWEWVEPILNHWAQSADPPKPYTSGSWGPGAASAMIARDGFAWAEEA